MSRVREVVVEAIAREEGIDPDSINDGDELVRDLGLTERFDVVTDLEEVFDTDVDEETAEAWRTVEDVVRYFEAAVA